MILRPYQNAIIADARSLMSSGIRSLCITSPTGSGKTVLVAHMFSQAASKGLRSIFTVHRRELLKQSMATFDEFGIPYGVIAAGWPMDRRRKIQIASIQTLARRLKYIDPPDMLVIDEAHHVPARQWSAVLASFRDCWRVGLTATPERLDGKGLGDYFQRIIYGPAVADLISQGFLSDFKIYCPAIPDLKGAHTKMGDYVRAEIGDRMDRPTITGDAIGHYRRLAAGRRFLARGVSIEHSKNLARAFNDAGIATKHVDGDTPADERDRAMRDFREGRILGLVNVDLFSEGLDVPGIEAAIDLRPTQSLTLWLQFCGRALRPAEGKAHAIILDHAGNAYRHGLPDEPREWSLAGREKTSGNGVGASPVKICPACFGAQRPGPPKCRYCGAPFPVKAREVEEVDGDLREIEKIERVREFKDAKDFDGLAALARKRGYKNPDGWARIVLREREAKRRQMVMAHRQGVGV